MNVEKMKTETLEVNGTEHLVKIHYEKRNNSRASIGKKAINIRIPSFLRRKNRLKELLKLKNWAKNKIQENPHKFKPVPQKEYRNGDTLKVGGTEYSLNIKFKDKKSSSARIKGNTIHLWISANLSKKQQNKDISTLLSRCIGGKNLPKLKEKIHQLNNKHFNQKINKVFFKHNKSNWGSCSNAGNINISTRLLFAPESVLEYVCVHELAHLTEGNHSKRFWALVEKAVPDYREKIKWLKENKNKYRF